MGDQTLFGGRIRLLRRSSKLSREQLAERARISSNYLGEIERGEKWPSLEVIGSLAAALGVSPSDFFDFESEKNSVSELKSKFRSLLENRNLQDIRRAYRIIKILFEL